MGFGGCLANSGCGVFVAALSSPFQHVHAVRCEQRKQKGTECGCLCRSVLCSYYWSVYFRYVHFCNTCFISTLTSSFVFFSPDTRTVLTFACFCLTGLHQTHSIMLLSYLEALWKLSVLSWSTVFLFLWPAGCMSTQKVQICKQTFAFAASPVPCDGAHDWSCLGCLCPVTSQRFLCHVTGLFSPLLLSPYAFSLEKAVTFV